MMNPSWDQGIVMYSNRCEPAAVTDYGCAKTQWWFWILAGALGLGIAMKGGKG